MSYWMERLGICYDVHLQQNENTSGMQVEWEDMHPEDPSWLTSLPSWQLFVAALQIPSGTWADELEHSFLVNNQSRLLLPY